MTGGFGVTCLRLVLVNLALTVHPLFSSFLVVARRHYRYNVLPDVGWGFEPMITMLSVVPVF